MLYSSLLNLLRFGSQFMACDIWKLAETLSLLPLLEEFNRQIELRQALKRLGFMKEVWGAQPLRSGVSIHFP